jgi:hypothetical protein
LVVVKIVPGAVPVPMLTRPVLVTPGMVWLKPLRSSVPALAIVTGELGLNVFVAPARNVPASTFVGPL